ncbi:MAG TPA: extracellular solute-binding protein [Solirubrobacteraceae bacterium]|nr:extracellular solute-binding protein [Solirubrobacteraceae bacterium]
MALGGCGQSNELVTLDRVGSPDAPNTLTFQMNAGYTPQAAVPEVAANFKKAFADWARRHPEWRLSLTVIPDSQGPAEQARLLERARVGTAPDCASVDSFSLPLFIEQKALVPLDRYFTKAEVDDLLPFVRRTVHGPDDHLYAWWWNTDLRLIYRNVDLVPKAPETWDELIAAAKAAKEKDPKVDGYLYNGGRYEGTFFDNLGYFWMQGGKLLDADGRPVFAEGTDRAAMLKMLAFLRETVTSGASPARVATINDYDVIQQSVEGGSVAMFLGGSFQWPTLQSVLPKEELAKWKISPIPGTRPGQTATGTGGWTVAALSDDPEKVAACASIIKEIYLGKANEITGELPTSQRLFRSIDTFKEPIYQEFRRLLRTGQPRPGLAIYPELSNQMQIAIGSVLTGGSSPEEALDAAGERVKQTWELQRGGT